MVSTSTQYRSPVRLVLHTAEEASPYSAAAINRARKKILAEISLAGDEILIEGVAYSKNDAATLLEGLDEEAWRVHTTIYNNKGLLCFLEKEEFNADALSKADGWLYNQVFVAAVSPWFAYSFNVVAGKLLKEQNFNELAGLLLYQGYISPEHSIEAFQKFRTYLDDLTYTVRNLSWEKFISDERILHFIFSDEWKSWLNALPSQFAIMRDELTEQLINLVLRFQHHATWYYLHQVLVQLKQVETNEFNRAEVQRIDVIIDANSRQENKRSINNKRSNSEVKSGRFIWWGIWFVLMIVRAATCNQKSTSYADRFNTDEPPVIFQARKAHPDEKKNVPLLLNFLDSLSRRPSLAINSAQDVMETGKQPFYTFADDLPQLGAYQVSIVNNTNHHCVVIYVDGPSKSGSVYQGALSHISSVYIEKSGSFNFRVTPGSGSLHFIFGEQWGKLKQEGEILIHGAGIDGQEGARNHRLFVYDFFSNKKRIKQKYLSWSVLLQPAANLPGYDHDSALNTSDDALAATITTLQLLEKGGEFSIKAQGSLTVKETPPAKH